MLTEEEQAKLERWAVILNSLPLTESMDLMIKLKVIIELNTLEHNLIKELEELMGGYSDCLLPKP